MKDALGHGSNARVTSQTVGNHQTGVLRAVQKLNTKAIGKQPWQTVGRYRNSTVAEKQAQNQRVDNPDQLIRIKRSG